MTGVERFLPASGKVKRHKADLPFKRIAPAGRGRLKNSGVRAIYALMGLQLDGELMLREATRHDKAAWLSLRPKRASFFLFNYSC